MNNNQLLEKLNKYPEIKSQFINVIKLLEKEDLNLADEAEMAVRDSLNGMGRNLLKVWAENKEGALSEEFKAKASKHRKKNSRGTQRMER